VLAVGLDRELEAHLGTGAPVGLRLIGVADVDAGMRELLMRTPDAVFLGWHPDASRLLRAIELLRSEGFTGPVLIVTPAGNAKESRGVPGARWLPVLRACLQALAPSQARLSDGGAP
jgi:hypothetical protein